VCQDFHAVRDRLPAIAGRPSDVRERLPGNGAAAWYAAPRRRRRSHAWLTFHCPGIGWIDVDPTNNLLPSTGHVTLARGLDYGDVSPIRGVILGGGQHSLQVSVDVVRVPDADAGG
jgi:transglutaminase-like putative cysteine protease